jgi:small conductance mechanosensitive channel
MENVEENILGLVATYGVDIVAAIVILVVGLMAAGWARGLVNRICAKSNRIDDTLGPFFANLIYYAVVAFVCIAVLARFGVQTTGLIAVFGAAGLAIGLALQGTLSNIAAGVMLLMFRPFKVGDFVEVAGIAGTVKSITLFVTELATADNVQILAPNGQVWGACVRNFSHHGTRRIDCVIGIGYEDDIDTAFASAQAVADSDDRVLQDPAPMIAVSELGDSAVNLTVRVWCNAGDYWPLRFGLNKSLKERFDADKISIPYPQRTVHLVSSEQV